MIVKCYTQAEMEAALKVPSNEVWLLGSRAFEISDSSQVRAYGSSQVRACGSSQVTAYDSSQVTVSDSSQVTAYGSSQVTAYGSSRVTAYGSSRVTAYGSSQVTAYGSSQVTAYGSSQVTAYDSSQVTVSDSSQVTAYGSSQVTAYGSSQVTAYGSGQVTAGKQVPVTIIGKPKVNGGIQIHYRAPVGAKEWIENYCLTPKRGIVVLYKGVDDNYISPRGGKYTPGTTPEAADWDGGREECGGGFHFSPHPALALKFNSQAKRFVACPVKVSEIVVHKNAVHPDKVKAPRVVAPGCYEVDINGNPIKANK